MVHNSDTIVIYGSLDLGFVVCIEYKRFGSVLLDCLGLLGRAHKRE